MTEIEEALNWASQKMCTCGTSDCPGGKANIIFKAYREQEARIKELEKERDYANHTNGLFKHPDASIRLGHGETCATQVQRIRLDENTAWERILRLHIKPRPVWCPEILWQKILRIVLIQSEERK